MSVRQREIVLPEADIQKELRRRTRRDFLIAGLASVAGIGGYEWVRSRKKEKGVPWPQRRVLGLDEKIAAGYLSDSRLVPTYSLSDVQEIEENGDLGLDDDVDDQNWNVAVENTPAGSSFNLKLADIKALPKHDEIIKFCCIEGWSKITHWSGARFADFAKKYLPPGQPAPKYVYMSTPNEQYYVGLDWKSAIHPQTLLAYEKDGATLPDDHGAPLRLVIPIKYGIKNIKRLGSIQFTNERPRDFWHDNGYDWFAGL